jgi:hypothetical protein
MRAAIIGLLSGAVPPLAYGSWVVVDELYLHPHDCGMGLLGGWMCIRWVAPIGGVLGTVIGCGCSALYRASQRTGPGDSV